jgi:hypothetical protein
MKSQNSPELRLTLHRVLFDQIAAGARRGEYREQESGNEAVVGNEIMDAASVFRCDIG